MHPTSVSLSSSVGYTIVSATTANGTLSIRVDGAVAMSDIITTVADAVQNGGAGDDILSAGPGDGDLYGQAGNDVLYGGSGASLLDGGTGNDIMFGGLGNDTYVVREDGDRIIELANGGTDTVESWIGYSLAPFVENITPSRL